MTEPLTVAFQRRATRETRDRRSRRMVTGEPSVGAPTSSLPSSNGCCALALMPTLGALAKSERARDVRRLLLRQRR